MSLRRWAKSYVFGVGGWGLLAVGAFVSAAAFSRGQMDTAVTLLILFTMAQGWNVLAGLTGQVSLGVGAFVGIGAYGLTLTMIHLHMSVVPALVSAAVIGAVIALVMSFAVFRLRGHYFTIGTLAVALTMQAAALNWGFLGGSQGLSVPSSLDEVGLYHVAAVLAVLVAAVFWLVRRSDFGLRMMAVRDQEDAAASLGVQAFRVKMLAFALSGAMIASAGGLLALQQFAIEPNSAFGLSWTVDAVVMTIVGGIGTVLGPAVGVAVIYYGIQQQLQNSAALSTIVTGAVILIVISFAPAGIWPLVSGFFVRLWDRRHQIPRDRPAFGWSSRARSDV